MSSLWVRYMYCDYYLIFNSFFLFQLIAVIQDLHLMVAKMSQMEVAEDFLRELWSLFTAIPTIHWVEFQKLNVVSGKTSIIGMEKYQTVFPKVSVFAMCESCDLLWENVH